jgi:PiT family inorganic phosphate transporter
VEIPLWLIAVAIGAGFYTCFMGGANDFANAFGTSIGSGAITMKQAVLIAAVAELVGATLVGSHVADTVRKGIVDPNLFANDPRSLVYGLMSAVLAAGVFLQLATRFGLPVSTTHATVGGVLGFGIIAAGFGAVSWGKMTQIVLSWFTSPICGGILGYIIFWIIQKSIIRSPKPVQASKRIMPWFVGTVVTVILLSFLYKGLHLEISFIRALLLAIPAGLAAAYISHRRLVHAERLNRLPPLETVENRFKYLQMMTAAYISFAHGANDVANGVGPLAGIWSIYRTGAVAMKTVVPTWILFMGGVGIVLGLAVFGRRVIETVGKKITAITPSRGFAAEFSAATTVLFLTKFGMPVSTTHTFVGAVIGVGFARGIAALDLRVVRNIFASWIVTLPATIAFSMIFFLAFRQWLS